ncbi:peptide-methionine (S)-S-oxide reductase MsrA [Aquimarina litoralis]|uniref:peptide-methionine (S)-S-oxide reductase n=1 Tax=Aquimarina litoralis TaxID=584605 RepID=A0ABN1J0P0_9FLAO
MSYVKIGFGGGCHWCTEAVFQSLRGIITVEQGYIASTDKNNYFSEAVVVTYDPQIIKLHDLIEIHLHTHKSTSNHSFRKKYRSAIYYFNDLEKEILAAIISKLNPDFDNKLITQILKFQSFQASREELLNYYTNNPEKPFCKRYIHPKLQLLREKYAQKTKGLI